MTTVSSFVRGTLFAILLVCMAGHVSGAQPAAPVELPIDLQKAATDWDISNTFSVTDDELLKRPVLAHSEAGHGWIASKASFTAPYEVVARIRLMGHEPARIVQLTCGAVGAFYNPDGACYMQVMSYPGWTPSTIRCIPVFGPAKSLPYANRTDLIDDPITALRAPAGVYIRERFSKISPLWDPKFREEIEAAMAVVPTAEQQWIDVRIVHDGKSLRMYKDGYLVGERVPAGTATGFVHLKLSNVVRVASLVVRPVAAQPAGFETVPLEGYCNAALADPSMGLPIDPATLPPRTKVTEIEGVPMRLPEVVRGLDHIDVGTSLFHYRMEEGHHMSNETWPAPSDLDGGRIRLAVPNRPWRRIWILAASDDQPNCVPLVTARFYRPGAGFSFDAAATVPALNAKGTRQAEPVKVKLTSGKSANVWLVPLEFDSVALASEMREEPVMCLELTKQVLPYRSYPDPANYGWFQGGLPSSVHILAMTLEEAPLRLRATSNRAGNTFVLPEQPVWKVTLENTTAKAADAAVSVVITDPLKQSKTIERKAQLAPGATVTFDMPINTTALGLHRVVTRAVVKKETFEQHGTLVQLPLDTRNATARNSHWGLWTWKGGHGTNPNLEENAYLNLAAGAHYMNTAEKIDKRSWDMVPGPAHVLYGPEAWASENPIDPEKYKEFKDRIGKDVAKRLEGNPDIPSFSIFTETAITFGITYGVPPEYLGEGELVMDEEAKKRFDAFWITAKAACEGIREHAPKAKIALGWCEPIFTVPFLKAGFPKEMFDLIGVDAPVFERTPEMPIREVTANRMWMLKEAMKKYGYSDKPVIHTESYYPTSHELALGHRVSADHTVRLGVLSLAMESDILANCYTLHDCSNYWGSQHYGCIGLVGRRPEYNPKEAFPAYATMTRLIDLEKYDGFVSTGSHNAYCVRFKHGTTLTYCLWTVRGERPITLTFAAGATPTLIDETGREETLKLNNNAVEVKLTTTPVWVRGTKPIESAAVGVAVYPDAKPGFVTELASPHVRPLDDLSQPWTYKPGVFEPYDENHFGAPRYPGPMTIAAVESKERGRNVMRVDMTKPDVERPLATWYGAFEPAAPIEIPGKAVALGVWANGKSNWGRVVYQIVDAKGEKWVSVGKKEDWNCDDTHTWSYFSHDGWRYLEFPLPNNMPGDNYREQDSCWWNFDADGVVDLPIKLTHIIVEARTHNVYVDVLEEVADRSVELSDLTAVYENEMMATNAPVALQRAAAGMQVHPPVDRSRLPNVIAELRTRKDMPAAAKIAKLAPPEHFYDGRRLEATVETVEGATEYRIYVSAHEDGTGASMMAKGAEPKVLVQGLRPEFPLYFFATYVKDKKESMPSDVQRVLLKDQFPMK